MAQARMGVLVRAHVPTRPGAMAASEAAAISATSAQSSCTISSRRDAFLWLPTAGRAAAAAARTFRTSSARSSSSSVPTSSAPMWASASQARSRTSGASSVSRSRSDSPSRGFPSRPSTTTAAARVVGCRVPIRARRPGRAAAPIVRTAFAATAGGTWRQAREWRIGMTAARARRRPRLRVAARR
ncbi:MAG TPA: hypothetical protein VFI18_12815 [Gaiellales bacterium]|nr:hypothetical protein [Gaiellales bacterium]